MKMQNNVYIKDAFVSSFFGYAFIIASIVTVILIFVCGYVTVWWLWIIPLACFGYGLVMFNDAKIARRIKAMSNDEFDN